MTSKSLGIVSALTMFLALPRVSEACGPCEYEDGLTHVCLPKAGCIIEQFNPITQAQKVLTLAQAIATDNTEAVKIGIGDLLINSPSCLTCASIAHNVLPNLSDQQIYSMVGEGFLVYLATGDPALVLIDVAANLATRQNVRAPQPTLPVPVDSKPKPNKRKAKSYETEAECLIQKKGDPNIYAAWKAPATFAAADGSKHLFPEVDLKPGDTLSVKAPLCPTWVDPSNGQESLTAARFRFDGINHLTGGSDAIKWFVFGPRDASVGGRVARVKATPACPAVQPWVALSRLGVEIGVSTTHLSSDPPHAGILIRKPGGGSERSVTATKGVEASLKIKKRNTRIKLSEVSECSVDYELFE